MYCNLFIFSKQALEAEQKEMPGNYKIKRAAGSPPTPGPPPANVTMSRAMVIRREPLPAPALFHDERAPLYY